MEPFPPEPARRSVPREALADPVVPGVVARLAAVRGEGTGGDGRVRVVVDGTGDLVELVIDPAALPLGTEGLAGAVREAFARARDATTAELTAASRRAQATGGTAPGGSGPDAEAVRGLADLAASANRRLAELSTLAHDLVRRLGPDAR